MDVSRYFPRDYLAARRNIAAAAAGLGLARESLHNPAPGPDGAALATDVVRIGPADASRLLISLSGTHGVETFSGSGIQVGLLESGLARELPPDTALLIVHAINPHGFAWLRRVTEGNVDLNRNYIEHGGRYPANPGYQALRDLICPQEWSDRSRTATRTALLAWAEAHGSDALQAAITGGQYVDPEGVFYGGQAPTWSHRTLLDILRRHAAKARQVALIDLHTGLGPHGHGEIMNGHAAGTGGHRRVEEWFGGEATSWEAGTSSSAVVAGDTMVGVLRALPHAEVTGITLEYGTFPLEEMIDAVRADNWLHVHGELDSPLGRAIKSQIRHAFYPDTDAWRGMVWERAVDVHRRMLAGLTRS